MRYVFGLLILLSSGSVAAQNPSLDTLRTKLTQLRRLPSSPDRDTTLILTTSLLTERMLGQNDPLAGAYIDTLRQLVNAHNWPKTDGLYWRAIGKKADVKGRYTDALTYYDRAAQSLRRAGGDPYELAYTQILAAFVLNNNNLVEQGKARLLSTLPLAKATRNTNNLCWIYDFFGDYYTYPQFGHIDYPKALTYYQKVENLLPRATSPTLLADNPHCLANVYRRLGQYQKADAYREKALQVARQVNNQVVAFAVHADLADWAEEQQEYGTAIDARRQSIAFARQSGWLEMESRATNALYNTYKQAGDYRNALRMLETYRQLEDSLGRVAVQQRYAELQTRYEAENRELRIRTLQNHTLYLTRNFLLALLLLGSGFAGYALWSNRQLKRKNHQLNLKNQEVSRALEQGQTMERNRMAGELHDNVANKILAVKMRLETLSSQQEGQENQKNTDNIVQYIDEVYADIRLLAHNLLPATLEENGLAPALRELIDRVNLISKTTFALTLPDGETRYPHRTEYELYCIALELINNVLKHAGATQATVTLVHEEQLTLTVSDNGTSIESLSGNGTGLGLRSIRSRVQSLRGQWQIDHSRGTIATVRIPV